MRLPTEDEIKQVMFDLEAKGDLHQSLLSFPSSIRYIMSELMDAGCFDDWRTGEPKENGHYRVMFDDGTIGSAYFGGAWNTAKTVAKWRIHEG